MLWREERGGKERKDVLSIPVTIDDSFHRELWCILNKVTGTFNIS